MAVKNPVTIAFKAPQEDADRWKEMAHERRMSLSAWIKERLGSAEPIAVTVEVTQIAPPRVKAKDVMKLAQAQLREQPKPTRSSCPRRLPTGTFCKTCGKTH